MSKVTGAVRHVHRYTRTFPYKRQIEPVWACKGLDGCTHFLPLGMDVLGRRSICHECGDEFIMLDHNLLQEFPTCSLTCEESQTATTIAARENITIPVIEQTPQEKEDAEILKRREREWNEYETMRRKK